MNRDLFNERLNKQCGTHLCGLSGDEIDLHSLEERIQNESNNCDNRAIVQQCTIAPVVVEVLFV